MGRARKPADAWMPPRVYRGRSSYEYRPRAGGCVTLCPLSSPADVVWAEYRRVTESAPPGTYAALQAEYLASPQHAALSGHTRRAYARYAVQLDAVFGAMPIDDIEPAHIRAWLDIRGDAKSPVVANREFALLRTVYRWGYERGRCRNRPAVGVRQFPEAPRARDVTDQEVAAFSAHCGPRLRAYVALKMIVPLRQGELLALPLGALRGCRDGLRVDDPSKGGVRRVIAWSPAMQIAVDAVLALDPVERTYTWPGRRGMMTANGLQNEWKRAMKAYVEAGGARFTEHDLRAAATAELSVEHAQAILGHQRATTTRRHYKRRPVVVKAVR